MGASIEPGSRAHTVLRSLFGVLAANAVVAAVTGAVLAADYRPSPADSWSNLDLLSTGEAVALAVRTVHQAAAIGLIVTTALAVGAALTLRPHRNRLPSWVPAAGLLLVWGMFVWTGMLLPWDGLRPREPLARASASAGYTAFFGSQLATATVRGQEVASAVVRSRLVTHVGALAAMACVLLPAARRWALSGRWWPDPDPALLREGEPEA